MIDFFSVFNLATIFLSPSPLLLFICFLFLFCTLFLYWLFCSSACSFFDSFALSIFFSISPLHFLICFLFLYSFLDASLYLYKRVCPPVGPSVSWSVRPSVCMSRFCKKCMNLRVSCTEMIKEANKVMNNIKTAL